MDPAVQPPRRSNSRSRRSHPTFSDLRLAPLKTTQDSTAHLSTLLPKTPTDPSIESLYRTNHSSYLTGRSLPSTPGGILTRSSSRKQLHGGLSRRSSIYDAIEPVGYAYDPALSSTGKKPLSQKSASEALLAGSEKEKQRDNLLRGSGRPLQPRSGTQTPTSAHPSRSRSRVSRGGDDDWLSHAVTYTSTLLAESKGHSYLHNSSSNLKLHGQAQASSSSDEEDHHYRTPRSYLSKSRATTPARSPLLVREGAQGWGSRFGSRANSTAPSRRDSQAILSSTLTPMTAGPSQGPAPVGNKNFFAHEFENRGYFDSRPLPPAIQPDFVSEADRRAYREAYDLDSGAENDLHDDDSAAENEIARLASTPGYAFGLASVVDRLVGFGVLDQGDEELDAADREHERDRRHREEMRWRREKVLQEARRKSAGNVADSANVAQDGQGQNHMWSDAMWLLGVAGRAIMADD